MLACWQTPSQLPVACITQCSLNSLQHCQLPVKAIRLKLRLLLASMKHLTTLAASCRAAVLVITVALPLKRPGRLTYPREGWGNLLSSV